MVSFGDGSHGAGSSIRSEPAFAHYTFVAQPSGSSSSWKRSCGFSPRHPKDTTEMVKVLFISIFFYIFCIFLLNFVIL